MVFMGLVSKMVEIILTMEGQVILAIIKVVFSSVGAEINRQWQAYEFSQKFSFIGQFQQEFILIRLGRLHKGSKFFGQVIYPERKKMQKQKTKHYAVNIPVCA